MELKKNAVFDVTIENCSGAGIGIARQDGLVLFVSGALRNERCRIRLLKVKKHVAYAKVEAVLSPSPARIASDCPHYPQCGGCAFRHMTYEEELEVKRLQVEDNLRRIGGLSIPVPPVLAADSTTGYRNKAQFPVSGADGAPVIGFYRQRTHTVIPVDTCQIQSPLANQIAQIIRQWMVQFQIAGYREETGTGLLRHIYVRTNGRQEALVCLVINGINLPHSDALIAQICTGCPSVIGVLINCNRRRDNVILGTDYHVLWGHDNLTDTLMGLQFRLSVPSFYQVNRAQTHCLYETALSYADLHGTETVVDLYCGVGTISLAMARHAKRVIGVELIPEAVKDAMQNAQRNQMKNAEFLCADAGTAAQRLVEQGIRPDVVVVDPPRKGLDAAVIDAVLTLAPARFVYISCDPATLARDLKVLSENGYAVRQIQPVDMFPRTKHVETVVLMSRVQK